MGIALQLHRGDIGTPSISLAEYGDDFSAPNGTVFDGDRIPPKTQGATDYAIASSGAGYPTLVNGRATSGDISSGTKLLSLPMGTVSYDAVVTLSDAPTSAATAGGGLLGAVDGASDYVVLTTRRSSSVLGYSLTQVTGGAGSTLASSSRVPVSGDVLWLERRGRLFRGYVNGELIAEGTISTDVGAFAGLGFSAGGTQTFDDLCLYTR